MLIVSHSDILSKAFPMYIAASINLVGQREKLTGQMPKLAGKCPVTDCYYEHCSMPNFLYSIQYAELPESIWYAETVAFPFHLFHKVSVV